jgi:dipeptidyl aminopeptidase/acylaminoacyl peptidase
MQVHVKGLLPVLVVTAAMLAPAAGRAGRPLAPEDWFAFQTLDALQIAPDGTTLAYIVTSYDRQSDESIGALWSVSWSGGDAVQLTRGASVSAPRFSPDGRYLSFLSARPPEGPKQLWLLDRRGGEPRQLTHVRGEISGYEWSPDARRVVLEMSAAAPDEDRPQPIVIEALHFKEDVDGYLDARSHHHLYLCELSGGDCDSLTGDSPGSESHPAWSPDGRQIAYLTQPLQGRDRDARDEIDLIDAHRGATPRVLLATWSPNAARLRWSPDGQRLMFLQGAEPRFNAYILDSLALADVHSGRVRALADKLDRAVVSPEFAADGAALEFAVEDDGYQYPARVTLANGAFERLGGPMVVSELVSAAGHTAVLVSDDRSPVEAYALEHGQLRRLSHHNDTLFAQLQLASVEDIAFRSRDGTSVHGQLLKPPGYVAGQRYPTIVWIHGGPSGQDDHSLELAGYGPPLERQLFATHGYVVLAINYRGGGGRGARFARSIVADWGHKEVEDLLAGLDYAVRQGIADPARLGVGGWSYGAILTNYLIASDTRFKAAISGAGSGNQLSLYGADEYSVEDNAEYPPPWRDPGPWLRASYPFFHADRIRTPTLFMGGDRDFNVPIAGGEQMYQALRTLGVPTRLVVYPGEYHTLTRPSFLVDRWQRFLGWMDQYLTERPR